jgi:intracellular septation protein
MQMLMDFLPLFVFFGAYKFYGIYAATVAIIVAMALQITVQWLRHRSVNKMTLISGGLVLVLGGITLALHNPIFIQWKPTIVYGLFAVGFAGSELIGGKNLTERMMGHAIALAPSDWRWLNLSWVACFALLAIANLYVVYHYDEATWVNFKLFGTMAALILLAVAQGVWITKRSSRRNDSSKP